MGVGSGLTCPGGASTQALPCGATYPVNTVVTLTPQADTGSTFLGWAGACSGTGACQLTLSTARLAAAIFSKTPTSSDVSYYHTDAIGSVRAITDAAGVTVIRHDYMAFGEDSQPLTGDPQRFGGMQLDPESALNYAGARYYRVSWGRFTQVDPVGGSVTNPQRWNGYAYALNNPLKYVDPMGMTASWTQDGDPCAMHGLGDDCYDSEMYSCWANGCNTPGQMSEMQEMAEAYYGMTDSEAAAYNGTKPKNTPSAETLPEGTVSTDEVFTGAYVVDDGPPTLDDLIDGVANGTKGVPEAIEGIIKGGMIGTATAFGGFSGGFNAACSLYDCGFVGDIGMAALPLTGFTRHGLAAVIGRDGGLGVKPAAYLDALKNPTAVIPQVRGGRPSTLFIGRDASVSLNGAGEVITAYATGRAGVRSGK